MVGMTDWAWTFKDRVVEEGWWGVMVGDEKR